jgi:hypothetical protein
MMSLALIKKSANALTIRIDMAMVMMVTAFKNLLSKISWTARLK